MRNNLGLIIVTVATTFVITLGLSYLVFVDRDYIEETDKLLKSDREIEEDIESQMQADVRVEPSEIVVEVDNGTAYLTGSVDTLTELETAKEIAQAVSGVEVVEDEMTIESPEGALISDDEIESRVNNSIFWHQYLEASDIEISVQDAVVYLEGSVDNYWKKTKAANVSSRVKGVAGIDNDLAVVPSDDVEDESIAENIVDNLERNQNVDQDDITVQVNNGVVTLTGTVSSYAESNATYNATTVVPGVTDINNDIDIDYSSTT
jgi:osmotically-inducible protein OsmY